MQAWMGINWHKCGTSYVIVTFFPQACGEFDTQQNVFRACVTKIVLPILIVPLKVSHLTN